MLKQEVEDKMRELIMPMEVKRIVDIGTGWGESAKFFSELKPEAKIYTIDGFGLYGDGRIYSEFDHDKVKKINEGLGKNVIQILGDSSKVPWELPIDILFLDGDHTKDGCSSDFINYALHLKKGGLAIFDDYTQENNPNNGVKEVVEWIVENPSGRYEMIYEGYYCAILKKK
jgi:predicted O-methyltransferase YrrM